MVLFETLRNHPLGLKLGELVPAWLREQRPSTLFGVSASILVASIMLGGGTRGGFLSDTMLELLAIPAFLAALSSLFALPTESRRRAKWALTLCSAIALVPLLQLVPLPPWMWTAMPHRQEMVAVFALLGRSMPWLPVSVEPDATWVSTLSLLPPLAIFLGVIQLGYRERRLMSLVVLGMGMVAAILGVIQVAQGPSSPLRFFAITSDTEAVGFFANQNHFAAFVYALLPFAAAWATDMAFTITPWRDRKHLETASVLILTSIFLVFTVLIGAEVLTRSRAGLALIIVAAFASLALPLADRRRPSRLTPIKLTSGLVLAVLLLSVQFGLYRVYEKFSVDPMQDARIVFARNTVAAVKAYMPFGSGVGTFVSVYPAFERPQDTIADVYVNHAHNDWLEMWLEGGVLSMVVMAAFAVWFALKCARIWRDGAAHARVLDLLLGRAATMVVPLIMAHSLVDYPLRTGAMMAVFALSCAFLVEPLVSGQDHGAIGAAGESGKETVSGGPLPLLPAGHAPDVMPAEPVPRPAEHWGEDIEWPAEWRK